MQNPFVYGEIVRDEAFVDRESELDRLVARHSATLVRRALRAYGVTPEAEPRKTGYDVIKHLLGSQHGGPADLSTNPEHLDDYGQ